ncbi:hypothetical protein LJR178_003811 [Variovorax sp. LjRoot178]
MGHPFEDVRILDHFSRTHLDGDQSAARPSRRLEHWKLDPAQQPARHNDGICQAFGAKQERRPGRAADMATEHFRCSLLGFKTEGDPAMCTNLLGMLADAKLPLTIADKALIDRLRMLDAMGYVKAFIPAVHVDCDNCARQEPAIALEVTPRGRKALSDEQSLEAAQVQRPAQMLPQGEPSRGAHLAWWHGGRRLRSGT